jgi:hypothetical protein
MLRGSTVRVENAGVPEVSGLYTFVNIKCNAGFYCKRDVYEGRDVRFTLYKCSVNNGGFQWFISITPEGCEPGTTKDTDFYFAYAKNEVYGNVLPPRQFNPLQANQGKEPGPAVFVDLPQREELDLAATIPGPGAGPLYGQPTSYSGQGLAGPGGSIGSLGPGPSPVGVGVRARGRGGVSSSRPEDLDSSSDEDSMVVTDGQDDTDGNLDESYNSSGVLDSPTRDRDYLNSSPNSIYGHHFDGV